MNLVGGIIREREREERGGIRIIQRRARWGGNGW